MQLTNGNVLVGHRHLDLEQITSEFQGVLFAPPLAEASNTELEDLKNATFEHVITECLAEVGESPHLATKASEALCYLFSTANIESIRFLGCYLKDGKIPETYVEQIEKLVFVLEFDH